MRHTIISYSWMVAAAFVQLAASEPLNPGEWRYYSPILASQTRDMERRDADSVLAAFCESPAHVVRGLGQTRTTRLLGSNFSGIADRTFHPKRIIFGHFLDPESDDAAVDGSSAEGHADRWGGTLLLSRRGGLWVPIWYRSGLIIDSCEKVILPNRRETLLCEDEDSGMGHSLHYLYTVDFEHPLDLEHSLLAKADSFKDVCVSQKQLLKGFHRSEEGREFSVAVETTEWVRLSTEPFCENYPGRRPGSVPLRFIVAPEGLRKMPTEASKK